MPLDQCLSTATCRSPATPSTVSTHHRRHVTQPAEDVDFNIVDAVRNDLVRISADLFAFNVARGWDIGLGTLNQIRKDLSASTSPYVQEAVGFAGATSRPTRPGRTSSSATNLSDAVIAQFRQAYPDLVLARCGDRSLPVRSTRTSTLPSQQRRHRHRQGHRPRRSVGRRPRREAHQRRHRRPDLLGRSAASSSTACRRRPVLLHLDRFDNFDFYENFIDGQEFADIVARNTGLTGLPEHMFQTRRDRSRRTMRTRTKPTTTMMKMTMTILPAKTTLMTMTTTKMKTKMDDSKMTTLMKMKTMATTMATLER